MQPNDLITPGTVWLVGAGPGDPDLLTRKAERLIGAADVVFYDALVGPGVLDLVRPSTQMVSVGKRSGRHSKAQDSINDLLVAAARAGKRVVRLKGGDPTLFGRATEEMEALADAGIACFLCPGITAATAAAASARLSLSLRGVSRRVQFATAHVRKGESLDLDWAGLADPKATTIFYMGRSAARDISSNLIKMGLSGATPVMIACDISLPTERLLYTRLDLLPLSAGAMDEGQPMLILVGEAIGIRQRADLALTTWEEV
ncbi:uroporphyrinogen-III C-methyltransferase [Sphingobium olei]|uniref:uroporphyrinogen-III C-methyltransferase n=1 Tax=Sphingobium olei TaxID=420955 RepID=A0ABW3P3J0_9SPHN